MEYLDTLYDLLDAMTRDSAVDISFAASRFLRIVDYEPIAKEEQEIAETLLAILDAYYESESAREAE